MHWQCAVIPQERKRRSPFKCTKKLAYRKAVEAQYAQLPSVLPTVGASPAYVISQQTRAGCPQVPTFPSILFLKRPSRHVYLWLNSFVISKEGIRRDDTNLLVTWNRHVLGIFQRENSKNIACLSTFPLFNGCRRQNLFVIQHSVAVR